MCKKSFQIDGLDSCLSEEDADARFGTYLAHSKQDTGYNTSLFFICRRGQEDKVSLIFLFYFIVLLSLLVIISKICIKDTMKA